MSYSDSQTYGLQAVSVTGTATFTASDHVAEAAAAGYVKSFPTFQRHTRVKSIGLKVKTAQAQAKPVLMRFLNGTSTIVTGTVPAAAAVGDAVAITLSGSVLAGLVFGSGSGPTIELVGTGTASSDTGVVLGVYDVYFEL